MKFINNAWNRVEDLITIGFNKIGGFKSDANARKAPMGKLIAEFMDKTGISNKNFFDRYNERHPDNLLPSPYEDNSVS